MGSIYVLDMGSPVKIADLARNLIRLSGYKPDVDIKIEYTGLRPGESMRTRMCSRKRSLTSRRRTSRRHSILMDQAIMGTYRGPKGTIRQRQDQDPAAVLQEQVAIPVLALVIPGDQDRTSSEV